MSYLFKIEGTLVNPNPEILLIEPFSTIWERDDTPDKDLAKKEFAYMEFMVSMMPTNPFREVDENKKHEKISENIFKNYPDWSPDFEVDMGIEFLKKQQTEYSLSYSYWLSNKIAAEKIKDFFHDFDMNERNPKTFTPIYKPKEITSSIADAEKTLTGLDAIKKRVEEEIFASVRNKGNKEISHFATLSSIK